VGKNRYVTDVCDITTNAGPVNVSLLDDPAGEGALLNSNIHVNLEPLPTFLAYCNPSMRKLPWQISSILREIILGWEVLSKS
jgi:hypothetical protein